MSTSFASAASSRESSPGSPVVIVGAGLAGLTVALHLARHGRRVIVLAKRGLSEGATSWAQGGICLLYTSDAADE